ncbi:MAG: hypothetical protein K0Q78_2202, partial [Cellvibrio sp.]|nr:hypothetical protein [Cellvibrio sp.]
MVINMQKTQILLSALANVFKGQIIKFI